MHRPLEMGLPQGQSMIWAGGSLPFKGKRGRGEGFKEWQITFYTRLYLYNMPRVKLFDQDEAKKKALHLFWEKGYEATSLSDLISCLGISKSSFYDTFQSKRGLFESCFDLYMSNRLEHIEFLLDSEKDMKTGLNRLLTLTLDEMLADEKHKGCFVANTSAELGGSDPIIRESLLDHHQALHSILLKYLNGFTWDYQISRKSFIDLMMTYVMGMNQEVKYHQDRDHFVESISHLMRLL